MQSIEGKKSRSVAVDALCQFLECSIHAYLLSRGIYPIHSFGHDMRFGLTVSLCKFKLVKDYIRQVCHSLHPLFLYDRIRSISVVSQDGRFTVEIPSDFGKSVFYSLPMQGNRSDLDVRSACTTIFREALIEIDRKLCADQLGRTNDFSGTDWEIVVDIKRNSVETTECMDMPSGWLLEKSALERNPGVTVYRKPIKSSQAGENVVLSIYADSFSDDFVSL
jgi:hypothetical protein